ncbi:DUF2326 domain-containing protein [Peptococcus simiae]|uniref:DUF2326 domain-containing protein n=1 Tax=Peptococcus simiae TaxID=1643805 RepID=UPI003980FB4A
MFIKSLKISTEDDVIREIAFHNGLNLIVDDTPTDNKQITGNNVGKTTVLKLIYFCLGGDGKEIYTDTEDKKAAYEEVKNYLIDNKVLITLTLTADIQDGTAREVIIERDFTPGRKAITRINGTDVLKKDFEKELSSAIFPGYEFETPSFKQVISHNIRYKDDSINNTLKTLNKYTKNIEYEALYLFLLGCPHYNGKEKQALVSQISKETLYKDRLEQKQGKNSYEMALALINDEIEKLNYQKAHLNLNENFEADLDALNNIKYQINRCSATITKLGIRKDIIVEAEQEMTKNISNIDTKQLEFLYQESKAFLPELHKTFEDLVSYHNKMIVEKINFITKELPALENKIQEENTQLKSLLVEEKNLSMKIEKSDSFEDLENIIEALNELHQKKGEYQTIISQIESAENNLADLHEQLNHINNGLYTKEFEEILKKQITKFNRYFSEISNELYGEQYALNFKKTEDKKSGPIYTFNAFNINMSSGKKQGEILCFDLAYTQFARDEGLPHLDFLLNDKKELLHDNQLIKVADYVEDNNIQLVISILKDKLPSELNNRANVAVELSQQDKLFRIPDLEN